MKYHSKQLEIETLVDAGMNVLLEGGAGSGKSTIIKNIAEKLNLTMYTMPMTKQTTMNSLLGFVSINGNYIPSQLRKAVEHGGLVLLDELDAADPNTVLCLNTLENGYLACPDGNIDLHTDFRLCATANPSSEHQIYTGRSKLDRATLDRFEIVAIDRDSTLEQSLIAPDTYLEITTMRTILSDNNLSKTLSMRDSIRFQKRKDLGLATGYESILLGSDDILVVQYEDKLAKDKPKEVLAQSKCTTIDELWESTSTPGKSQESTTEKKSTTSKKAAGRDLAILEARYFIKNNNISRPGVHIWVNGPSAENPFCDEIRVDLDGTIHTFKREELT